MTPVELENLLKKCRRFKKAMRAEPLFWTKSLCSREERLQMHVARDELEAALKDLESINEGSEK